MNRESERKRLVELIQSAPYGLGTLGEYFNKSYIENCIVQHLLDNGVIVPPCKVGDTLYTTFCYGIGDWRIETSTVYEVRKQIGFGKGIEIFGRIRNENGTHTFFRVELDQFGKTVFLTREEAEKMLKGESK